MAHSKPVFPQTLGHSFGVKTPNGVNMVKTVAELQYLVGDPTKTDGYFLQCSVLLTDSKGKAFNAYTVQVNRDLTVVETLNNESIFGQKDTTVTIGSNTCTKYFEIAFELLQLMSDEYNPTVGSYWVEPIAPFLVELIKVSELCDGVRHIDLDEIIAAFGYCHDLAGDIIQGSKFLGYCQQFAAIAATVKTAKPIAVETEEPIAVETEA
jgi:hypothetical protein